ncbi:hypothetical protein CAPTEDRAFT_228927 [Capitella teleta]|uniref:CUB domain-containing protein n=1 Tax=Capitella teleta TaxID=283909 RepID=R7U977_CAPTE|nr:hypothetical protein CAPTEDRAFT_228927 [Capitella teleta]|eukprot:ELT99685.1 hypothetical protein CAPTEDRAFT_228927 [Capitella teleta]
MAMRRARHQHMMKKAQHAILMSPFIGELHVTSLFPLSLPFIEEHNYNELMRIDGSAGENEAIPAQAKPMAKDTVSFTCWNFTEDLHGGEFYSPNYPRNYRNRTDCIQVLVAPPRHHIRLDFREVFHIEYSERCKHDYLEVRDGPFGYSKLLWKTCGTRFPQVTKSTSRYLWVRFTSDDSIEYQGFHAIYDFYKPSTIAGANSSAEYQDCLNDLECSLWLDEVCTIDVDVSSHDGSVSHLQVPTPFLERSNITSQPIDCTWSFRAPREHRIWIQWSTYIMTKQNNCDSSFIEIYERTTSISDKSKGFCGEVAKDARSSSNIVYLRMFGKSTKVLPKFEAIFTVFTLGPCAENLFSCQDGFCINRTLLCNLRNNCNSGLDESSATHCIVEAPEPTTKSGEPKRTRNHTIILGIVGGLLITTIVMSIAVTCWQRRKEHNLLQSALKQEKRHAAEVEMANLLNRTPRRDAAPRMPTVIPTSNTLPRINNHAVPTQKQNGGTQRRSSDFDVLDDRNSTYKRYLDVTEYNDVEIDVFARGPIRADVVVERNPRKKSDGTVTRVKQAPMYVKQMMPQANGKERSPSPRPDIVGEEKFVYPTIVQDHLHSYKRPPVRQRSADNLLMNRSDIWKPRSPDLGDSRPRKSNSNSREAVVEQRRARSGPGSPVNGPLPETYIGPARDDVRRASPSKSNHVYPTMPPDRSPRIIRHYPGSPTQQRSYVPIQPPLPVIPAYEYSKPEPTPLLERSSSQKSRKSPRAPRKTTSPRSQRRIVESSKSPDMFYTRPNLQPSSTGRRSYQV